MGILGLQDQELEKENSEERCKGGKRPAAVSRMDTLAHILKLSSILHLELARLPPLPQETAVAIGETGYVEVTLTLRSFVPRQLGLA